MVNGKFHNKEFILEKGMPQEIANEQMNEQMIGTIKDFVFDKNTMFLPEIAPKVAVKHHSHSSQ